jgi:hypothetical protein
MKPSRLYKIFAAAILICAVAMAMSFLISFKFNPDPSGDASFIARAQQKSAPGIKVNISALGARESQQSFGEDLAKYNIQPVWLSIENETDDALAAPATRTRTQRPRKYQRCGSVFLRLVAR